MLPLVRWLLLLLLPAALGCLVRPAATATVIEATLAEPKEAPTFGRPQVEAVAGALPVVEAKVVHFGRTIHEGKIDLNPTLERIRAGDKLDHANDGSIFRNFEGRLPKRGDRDYYREFVVKMRGLPFPGPQRLIIGKAGEVFYTGDHYESFLRVR